MTKNKYVIKMDNGRSFIATVNAGGITDITDKQFIEANMKDRFPNEKYEYSKLIEPKGC